MEVEVVASQMHLYTRPISRPRSAGCSNYLWPRKWLLNVWGSEVDWRCWRRIFGGSRRYVLGYRVYVLYKENKYLCFCFIALYIGVQATTFSLVGTLSKNYVSIPNPAPQLRPLLGNCIQSSLTFKITSVWIIYLGFHSILFMCLLLRTAYRCYEAWNNEIRLSLFYIFIRDGSWAYFLIVVSLVLCVVSAFDSRVQYLVGPSVMWLFTITSVCCCHLILNLRIAAYNELSLTESMSLPWEAVSDLRIETVTMSTTTVTSISSTVV